jgi:hypothetical protein
LCRFGSRIDGGIEAHLVKVDDWLPEVVSLLVEVSHSDLSEVTWMVLIHVRSVVVLTTGKTTTTGMLAVLSYTTVSSRDMSAAIAHKSQYKFRRRRGFRLLRDFLMP